MLDTSYKIHDIKLLLELSDSARKTLLILLEQFKGSLTGTLDRSNMNIAEKQRLKRGIAELKDKGVIFKSINSRAQFTLSSHFIDTTLPKTRDEHYLESGYYRSEYSELLAILIATEHFFDEFYNKTFIIKFKVYTKTPRIPAKVFNNMLKYTEDIYHLERNTSYGSILNKMISITEYLKHLCDSRQNYLFINKDERSKIVYAFKSIICTKFSSYPGNSSAEAKALCKFIQEWFSNNYPELII